MIRRVAVCVALSVSAVAVVTFAVGQPVKSTESAPKVDPLRSIAALAPFIGEWKFDGKWEDGSPLKARTVYGWGVGRKHVKFATFVAAEKGEYQRYEGFLTWQPDAGCFAEYSFAFDGAVSEYRLDTADGQKFAIGFTPLHADHPAQVRQEVEFTDANTQSWTVEMHAGEAWQRIMKGEWKRVK